jgi:hypothetical protein
MTYGVDGLPKKLRLPSPEHQPLWASWSISGQLVIVASGEEACCPEVLAEFTPVPVHLDLGSLRVFDTRGPKLPSNRPGSHSVSLRSDARSDSWVFTDMGENDGATAEHADDAAPTRATLAQLLGVSPSAVRKGVANGRLELSVGRDPHGRPVIVDAALAVREWRDNSDPSRVRL